VLASSLLFLSLPAVSFFSLNIIGRVDSSVSVSKLPHAYNAPGFDFRPQTEQSEERYHEFACYEPPHVS
jgi:hypothetical protein